MSDKTKTETETKTKTKKRKGIEIKGDCPIKIWIRARANQTIERWADIAPGEFQCWGEVAEFSNEAGELTDLVIEEVFLPRQENSGADSELPDEGFTELMTKIIEEDPEKGPDRIGRMRAWIHSHAGFGTFFSGRDTATINEFAGYGWPYGVFLVVNKKGERTARFDYFGTDDRFWIYWTDIKIRVDWPVLYDKEAADALFKERCSERKYTSAFNHTMGMLYGRAGETIQRPFESYPNVSGGGCDAQPKKRYDAPTNETTTSILPPLTGTVHEGLRHLDLTNQRLVYSPHRYATAILESPATGRALSAPEREVVRNYTIIQWCETHDSPACYCTKIFGGGVHSTYTLEITEPRSHTADDEETFVVDIDDKQDDEFRKFADAYRATTVGD